jgi:hypothetical protein
MPAKPTLHNLVQDAHKKGAVSNRFSVTKEEAARIRKAEAKGEGLAVVLQILREKTAKPSVERF